MQPLTRSTLQHLAHQLGTLATIESHEGDDDAAELLTHLAGECEDASRSGSDVPITTRRVSEACTEERQ